MPSKGSYTELTASSSSGDLDGGSTGEWGLRNEDGSDRIGGS